MSGRVTVQGKIGRSATTNPLDEGINPYQSIGRTLRSGTGIVISRRVPLELLWGNAMKKMIASIEVSSDLLRNLLQCIFLHIRQFHRPLLSVSGACHGEMKIAHATAYHVNTSAV